MRETHQRSRREDCEKGSEKRPVIESGENMETIIEQLFRKYIVHDDDYV